MRPYQTILVLEDLRSSFSSPLYRQGVELSSNDRATVMDIYLQWLCLMLDLGYLSSCTLANEARKILSDMVEKDVLELNKCFAELLQSVRLQQNRGFKVLCSGISSHLHYYVKPDMLNCCCGDVYAARRLVQLFSYTSRLTLTDIDLTQQCLEDYCSIEDSMLDSVQSAFLPEMKKYLHSWLKPFDPTRIHFKHGPGAVAGITSASLEDKYKSLSTDQLLEYAFGAPWWVHDPARSFERVSQTIFVPKSYKTFRTISMEPATLQYCQQGVWGEIDRVVADSPFLRKRIGFHHQERNQQLAKQGSLLRNYATIDLSSASDSVSYALVKELFRGTKLLRYIVATRSPYTKLPDGRTLKLKKFAPMGSALCFPIETLIFASLCQCITREHGVPGDYSVFGDDIIVPTHCAGLLVESLEELGFRVNREKSFAAQDNWFRESCGAEFCDGFDVTPMRVSRKYSNKQQLVRAQSLIDLANLAYTKGYRNLRAFFIRKYRDLGYKPLFGPNYLLGDSYSNYHLKKRWNKGLQRYECRASALTTRTSKNQDETIRYRHWLESTAQRGIFEQSHVIPSSRVSFDEAFVADVGRTAVFVRERWLEKPFEQSDELLFYELLEQRRGEIPPS